MRTKVTVVGNSGAGATTAQRIAERDYADVVLIDNTDEDARRTAHDLNQAAVVGGYAPNVVGTADYAPTAGSDIVVITASDDVRHVAEQVKDRSPDSIVITAMQPVEVICHIVAAVTEFTRGRVIGLADSALLRYLVARELGVSARDVQGLVLGGGGDVAVPLLSATAVGGIPVRKLVSRERLDEIARQTRAGDRERASAASAAVVEMVDAIALDQKRVLACAALCQHEYALDGAFVAVPVVLGTAGIEEIIELDLEDEERARLAAAALRVKQAVAALPG